MTATVLAAILSLLPARADREAEAVRLRPLATAIAEAVVAAPELPYEGAGAREAAALALVAVAHHESGFDARVIDCRRRGTKGDATAFQLLGPVARGPYSLRQLCASPRLAAERAVAVLSLAARYCPRSPHVAAFQGYASGRCGRPAPIRVRRRGVLVTLDPDGGMTRCRTWSRLATRAGLHGASCYARGPVSP